MLLALQTRYQAYSIGAISIPSAEAFGLASIVAIASATGIPSAESFGAARVVASVGATGIASSEAFGRASIAYAVASSSIPSGEAFGSATISPRIVALSIPSDEAFGTAIVSPRIAAFSIPSAEAFGLARAIAIAPPSPSPGQGPVGGYGGYREPRWVTVARIEVEEKERLEHELRDLAYAKIEKRVVEEEAAEDAALTRESLREEIETARRLVQLSRSGNEHEATTAARMLAKLLQKKRVLEEVLRHLDEQGEADFAADEKKVILQLASGIPEDVLVRAHETPLPEKRVWIGVSSRRVLRARDAKGRMVVRDAPASPPVTFRALLPLAYVPGAILLAAGSPLAGLGLIVLGALGSADDDEE